MGTKNDPGPFNCHAAADPDEPLFTLLGRDPHAESLVRRWARNRWREACDAVMRGENASEDRRKAKEAFKVADAMRDWREGGRERAKAARFGAMYSGNPHHFSGAFAPVTPEEVKSVLAAAFGGRPLAAPECSGTSTGRFGGVRVAGVDFGQDENTAVVVCRNNGDGSVRVLDVLKFKSGDQVRISGGVRHHEFSDRAPIHRRLDGVTSRLAKLEDRVLAHLARHDFEPEVPPRSGPIKRAKAKLVGKAKAKPRRARRKA